MNNYPCAVRINRKALKEYMNLVMGQPDILIGMSELILKLASTRIWDVPYKKTYDLHGLVGNLHGLYDVHLPIREDIVVIFEVITPLKIKIKSIGSHNDIFD